MTVMQEELALLKKEHERRENEHGDVVYVDAQGRAFTEEELIDRLDQEQYERMLIEKGEK